MMGGADKIGGHSLAAEKLVDVAATVQYAKNQRIFAFDSIDDHILTGGIAPKTGS